MGLLRGENSHMSDVVIIDGVRTAIGKMGGSLSSIRPDDLLAHAYKGLI